MLRFAANPRGERAAWRALQLVPGIGAATAGRLIAQMAAAADPAAALLRLRAGAGGGAGLVGVRGAVRGAARARRRPGRTSIAAVERWYRPQLERLHDDAAPRAADVAHLVRLAAGYVVARPLPHRARARPARRDQRRVRARLRSTRTT